MTQYITQNVYREGKKELSQSMIKDMLQVLFLEFFEEMFEDAGFKKEFAGFDTVSQMAEFGIVRSLVTYFTQLMFQFSGNVKTTVITYEEFIEFQLWFDRKKTEIEQYILSSTNKLLKINYQLLGMLLCVMCYVFLCFCVLFAFVCVFGLYQ